MVQRVDRKVNRAIEPPPEIKAKIERLAKRTASSSAATTSAKVVKPSKPVIDTGPKWQKPEKPERPLKGKAKLLAAALAAGAEEDGTEDGSPKLNKRGGPRKNAGRPSGAISRLSRAMIDAAKKTGLLPHEFLLIVVQQGRIPGTKIKVDFQQQLEAARAAAPYYAPRLNSVDQRSQQVVQMIQIDPNKLKDLSPDELAVLERVYDKLQRGTSGGPGGAPTEGNADVYAATLNAFKPGAVAS